MLLFLILSGSNSLHAQHDTISLNPLTVRGFAPERFMAGLKVQRIDSVTIQQFRFQNISELLAFHSPMAFKNYGPGQLNTVAFRGTSSMHTAVLWNGLNINQPNLGQTDFSTLPVAGFERLAVQYGASASVVGTDAVGGSLLLESAGRQPSGLRAQLCRQQGSFNNFQTQAGATYGGKAGASSYFSGKTLVYDGQMNNNYGTTERRNYLFEPSKSRQRGLVQDLTWNLRKQRQISAHAWFTDNSVVLAPENPVAREQTRTQSYRSMVQYQTPSWTWRTAWIRDLIEFGKGDFSTPEHTGTDRFVTRLEKEKEWNLSKNGSPLSVRMGAELAHYRTRVEGYTLPLITENRADIFVMSRWQATERLLFSAALRQAFVTRFDPPLTPSVGVDYVFFTTQKTTLKAKGAVAKSYRVPTLNERYWKTLGNPDIRPERSWNKEIGVELKQNIADSQILTASLTAFHNRVDDWTYWNPERNYRVENLQLVVARGVEFLSRYQTTYLRWQLGATAGYALTRASQERLYDAYAADIVGKQLVYVPVHQGNLTIFAQRGTLRLTALGRAVKRSYYTFDNSRNLPGYVFVSLLGEKTLTLARLQATMQAQVHNLTNAFYLNVKRNAMPGRSFSFTLLVAYNSESK
ncbi:TonB-dependent receptor [Arundinibacter roseus]|uniref:TonB-dependent receptor n=2 Tax=Arundinibacter roseus TaxID=2070510 RepID=A0A4R4KLJ2_9BACT|nr:TonB-dependent receptor [Arundinibacter roseus]